MWAEYGNEVQFFVVYIREAHAIDSPMPILGEAAPTIEDPMHLGERRAVAKVCMQAIGLEDLPNLVDDVDDAVSRAYQAWPDRLVLVGRDGSVAYQGLPGPWGLDPEEFERAILSETAP